MSNSDMSDEDARTQLQRDKHLSSAPPSYKIRQARKRRSQSTRVRRQRTESDSTTSSSEFERDPGGSQGSSSDSMVSLEPAVPVSVNSGTLQRLASVQMEPMSDFQRSLYLDMVDESGFESATSQTVMGNRSQKKRRLHRHRVGAMDDWDPVTDPSEHATPWRSPSPGHLYVEPSDTTAKHFPSCYRCQRRPAWLELAAIRARQSHLRRAEVKHRKSIRAEKRRRRRVDPVDSRVHRRQGHYDPGDYEGIHDLGIARVQLQEQIEATRDSGAWLECCTCSASVHTGCLADGDAEKLLRTVIAESKARQSLSGEVEDRKASSMSSGFSPTDVLQGAACTLCKTSSKRCMICRHDSTDLEDNEAPSLPSFRCQRCLRTAHYACLEQVTGADSIDDAAEARQKAGWMCLDCESWGDVDAVLAWRPDGLTAEPRSSWQAPHKPTDELPREYLVKFRHASFKETQWVPHFWLQSVHRAALAHFLLRGSRLELEPSHGTIPGGHVNTQSDESQSASALQRRSKRLQIALTLCRETGEVIKGPPAPEPDADRRIPKAWVTPDRVLDVYFASSSVSSIQKQEDLVSLDPRPIMKRGINAGITTRKTAYDKDTSLVHVSRLDPGMLQDLTEGRILDLLESAKVLIKWEDLEYQEATWEENVTPASYGAQWRSFVAAFRRHLASRDVFVKQFDSQQTALLNSERRRANFQPIAQQPDYAQGGKMLDFQIEGLNWLRYGWHARQPGILADEMGLGKTVQVISFLASLHRQYDGLAPYLVVVPNAVVTQWVREIEKWCPHLHVVPYYGGRESRGVIERFEMFHLEAMPGRQELRAEVIVCSDSVARLDPAPLRRVETWAVMVVDEGTNLKGGANSLIYRRLASLHADHRLIMTGTPLNNNLSELFNMLRWLTDGREFNNVKASREQFETLSPALVKDLQEKLRPFILRRLKRDVVDLPPRAEMLVPVSLTPLQKRVYKDVLERNIEDIQSLVDIRGDGKQEQRSKVGRVQNILVQLRKVCQHPYLVAPTLEKFQGTDVDWSLEARRLVEASSKLTLLQKLLPKLRRRGHRVLIFSQFVIYLDIVESFLINEGIDKYLRLDGSIGHRQRQKGIAQFNAPGSNIFCYLISTRAGGVGLNLASADTVIVLDSDWNPHIDMQAIARAHRIGQKKKVLVFTLVCKDTAEERIMQSARKKLVLNHIIRDLDDESEGRDQPSTLQEALRFGARTLFTEGGTEATESDTRFTDADVDRLIRDCENGEDVSQRGDASEILSFANVWERTDQTVSDSTAELADEGFWSALLERSRAEKAANSGQTNGSELIGRGGQRRAKMASKKADPTGEAEAADSSNRPNLSSVDDDADLNFGVDVLSPNRGASPTSQPTSEDRRHQTLQPEALSSNSILTGVGSATGSGQSVPPSGAARPAMTWVSRHNSSFAPLYAALERITDANVAQTAIRTAFPGRFELADALFNKVWSDIMGERRSHVRQTQASQSPASATNGNHTASVPSVSSSMPATTGQGEPGRRRRGRPSKKKEMAPSIAPAPELSNPIAQTKSAAAMNERHPEPPRSLVVSVPPTSEMQAWCKDWPSEFTKAVKTAYENGQAKPPVVASQRSRLTRTHMAYFSLRILQYAGVHPFFDYAFVETPSEHVPENMRRLPFQGAENLSMAVIQQKLVELAAWVVLQIKTTRDASTVGRELASSSAPPSTQTDQSAVVHRSSQQIPRSHEASQIQPVGQTQAQTQGAHGEMGARKAQSSSSRSAMTVGAVLNRPASGAADIDGVNVAISQVASSPPNQSTITGPQGSKRGPSTTHAATTQSHKKARPAGRPSTSTKGVGPPPESASQPGAVSLSELNGGHHSSTPSSGQSGPIGHQTWPENLATHSLGGQTTHARPHDHHSSSVSASLDQHRRTTTHIPNEWAQLIPRHAQPPLHANYNERRVFYWLQAIDFLQLGGLSQAARVWLATSDSERKDLMGREISARLSNALEQRARLGQPLPTFPQ